MAVPKRRTSKSVKRKRRTHDSLTSPTVPRAGKNRPESSRSKNYFCSNCNQPKTPHAVCPNCGHYRGRPLVEVER